MEREILKRACAYVGNIYCMLGTLHTCDTSPHRRQPTLLLLWFCFVVLRHQASQRSIIFRRVRQALTSWLTSIAMDSVPLTTTQREASEALIAPQVELLCHLLECILS
jgi:hypothetical protein